MRTNRANEVAVFEGSPIRYKMAQSHDFCIETFK